MKRTPMKTSRLLSALLMCLPLALFAQGSGTTYYVSTAGSDGNDGKALDRAFATIGKAAAVMQAGDQCLIRQGIYRETVKPVNTGRSGAPLTFEAYGNDSVYISGLEPVTGWTVHSGSIYKAQMPWNLGRYKNQIIVDGKMAWVARSPNVDAAYVPNPYSAWFGFVDRRRWQTLTEPIVVPQRVNFGSNGTTGYGQVGSSYNFALNDEAAPNKLPAELFGRPADFFKGGLISVHAIYWTGSGLISASRSPSATRMEIDAGRINPMSQEGGGGGWISHLFGLLDAPNEWYLDSATQTLYLWAPGGGNPADHLVEAKRRVLGFDLTGKQYVTVRNLRFIGASMTLSKAQNCTIESCQFKYVAHGDVPTKDEMGTYYAIKQDCSDGHLGVYVSGRNNVLRKCLVRGSAFSGIVLSGKYCTVTNSIITACNYSPTYHAGILVQANNGDWSDTNMPAGIDINRSYFAYHMRACIQVGCHTTSDDPAVRIKIHNNNFGTSVYETNESGQIAAQSCGKGEVYRNYFHDVGFIQMASVCTESDFGAQHWIIHHNVIYRGDSCVYWPDWGKPSLLRCCDWTFTMGDTSAKCFNNTIVDTTDPAHKDWETITTFSGQPFGALNKNNLWGNSDTVKWLYTDPVRRDYTLRAGSPAIDKGEVIPGWVDTYKGAAPDLGAFEYGDTAWTAGPDWAETPWTYPPGNAPAGVIAGAGDRGAFSAPSISRAGGALILRAPFAQDRTVTVFDARGRIMYRAKWSREQRALAIDTRALRGSVYLVNIAQGDGACMWKVCALR